MMMSRYNSYICLRQLLSYFYTVARDNVLELKWGSLQWLQPFLLQQRQPIMNIRLLCSLLPTPPLQHGYKEEAGTFASVFAYIGTPKYA